MHYIPLYLLAPVLSSLGIAELMTFVCVSKEWNKTFKTDRDRKWVSSDSMSRLSLIENAYVRGRKTLAECVQIIESNMVTFFGNVAKMNDKIVFEQVKAYHALLYVDRNCYRTQLIRHMIYALYIVYAFRVNRFLYSVCPFTFKKMHYPGAMRDSIMYLGTYSFWSQYADENDRAFAKEFMGRKNDEIKTCKHKFKKA